MLSNDPFSSRTPNPTQLGGETHFAPHLQKWGLLSHVELLATNASTFLPVGGGGGGLGLIRWSWVTAAAHDIKHEVFNMMECVLCIFVWKLFKSCSIFFFFYENHEKVE